MADEPRFTLAPLTTGQEDQEASPSIPGGLEGVLGFLKTLLLGNAPGEPGGPAPGLLMLSGIPFLKSKTPKGFNPVTDLMKRDPNIPGPVLEPLRGIQSIRNGQVVSPGVHGLIGALRELGIQPPPRLSQNYGVRPGTVRLGDISSRRSGEGRAGYGTVLYKDEVETLLDLTRQRYIELARQLHPDAPGGGNAEEMKKLNVLYDYAKKGLLDRRMTAPVRPEGGPPLTGIRPIGGGSDLGEKGLPVVNTEELAWLYDKLGGLGGVLQRLGISGIGTKDEQIKAAVSALNSPNNAKTAIFIKSELEKMRKGN